MKRAMRCAGLLAAFASCGTAAAGEGELDTGFAPTGTRRVAFDRGTTPAGKADHLIDLMVQPDGKVVLFGSSNDDANLTAAALARLMPNGGLDLGFDGDGKVVFGTFGATTVRAATLQADGRFVVAALTELGDPFLTRRAANGAEDPFPGSSFNALPVTLPNVADVDVLALHSLPDGRFLAAGTAAGAAAGTDFFVARFDANGALDASFGTSPGYTRVNFALDNASADVPRALAVAADGRIAAIGSVSAIDREYGVVMLDANGAPVASFDADGRAVYDFDIGMVSDDRGAAGCFLPDGRLVLIGTANDAANGDGVGMALVTATGALAPAFGSNGRRVYSAFTRTTGADVVCTEDGKFVVTGTIDHPSATLAPTEAWAARFDATGANDNTFGASFGIVGFGLNTSGASGGRDDQGKAIAIDPSGRYYAAFDAQFSGSDYDFGVARLTGALLFADGFE